MLSIIIPAYNEEKYIKNCLVSLAEQVDKDFDIVLVDNNCTDNTVRVAEEVAKEHNLKLSIIKEREKGIMPARTKGFEFSQSEHLASTDADVLVDKNWIVEIKNKFSQGYEFLVGDTYFDKSFWVKVPNLGKWFKETQQDLHKIIDFFPSMTNPNNFAFTKKCFNDVKQNILANKDDRIYGFNAALLGYKLEKLKAINIASPRRFVFEFFTLATHGTYVIRENDFRDDEEKFKRQCEIVDQAAKENVFDSERLIKIDIKEYLFPAILTNKKLFKERRDFFERMDEVDKYVGDKIFFSNLRKILEIADRLTEKYLSEVKFRLAKL